MNLKIEKRLLEEIILDKNNPKEHTQNQIDKIKASIINFGFNDPIAIDENNVIIEGNGRYLSAKQLEMKEIPVIVLGHLNKLQKKQYVIAHNKLTMATEFNLELLEIELKTIEKMDGDLEIIGFELEELEKFELKELNLVQENNEKLEEILSDIDKTEPFSKKNDIWKLGNHRLICGNSIENETYKILLKNEKVDLLVTDPPYNVNYHGKTKDNLNIQNDNLPQEEFYKFLHSTFSNISNILKQGAMFYIFYADSEAINFRNAIKENGLYNSQTCIWVKNHFVLGRQDYHHQHEPVLIGWKEGASHKFYGDRKQTTVWYFDKAVKNEMHPTIKPTDLIEYIIKNSSQKKDVILDCFGGSGTTLMAAESIGRVARIIEIDEKYVDVIVKRYLSLGKEDVELIRENKTYNFEELRKLENIFF